jgi:hypothetical protein
MASAAGVEEEEVAPPDVSPQTAPPPPAGEQEGSAPVPMPPGLLPPRKQVVQRYLVQPHEPDDSPVPDMSPVVEMPGRRPPHGAAQGGAGTAREAGKLGLDQASTLKGQAREARARARRSRSISGPGGGGGGDGDSNQNGKPRRGGSGLFRSRPSTNAFDDVEGPVDTLDGTQGQMQFEPESKRKVLHRDAVSLVGARQAKFARLRTIRDNFDDMGPAQQRTRVKLLREVVDFMKGTWRMKMPSVIFSVTGNAAPFEMRPKFKEHFTSALLYATRSTNAWIVTGGTDAGIMKLVGDALSKHRQVETALGIATWGTTKGRTDLTDEPDEYGSVYTAHLKASMPLWSVRVDGIESPNVNEPALTSIYGRFGVVIGVSIFETEKERRWAIVTFRRLEEAEDCCKSAKKVLAGAVGAATFVTKPFQREWLSADAPTQCKVLYSDWQAHVEKVLSSHGSVSLPYIYKGEKGEQEVGPSVALNPNHSHYLLVDDGTQGKFGADLSFRQELLDFISFRFDDATVDAMRLTEKVRDRRSCKRSVPVICIAGGGGPNTLETVLMAIQEQDPVIIMRDSGRACDLICAYHGLTEDILKSQTSMIRRWVLAERAYGETLGFEGLPTTTEEVQKLEAAVESLRVDLNQISSYPQLFFFNFHDASTSEMTADETSASNDSNALLPMVLQSIFRSESVEHRVKLPLAIRFNDVDELDNLLQSQGLNVSTNKAEELSVDTRPLVFAAYHDRAEVVRELVSYGFGVEQLDQLIFLELYQLGCQQKLLHRREELPIPSGWKDLQKRKLAANMLDSNDFIQWHAMSKANQEQQINKQWVAMSYEQQMKITMADVMSLTWTKLPFVTGWSYRATGQIHEIPEISDPVPSGQGGLHRTDFDIAKGDMFRQISVDRDPTTCELVVTLVTIGKKITKEFKARVISSEDAKQAMRQAPQSIRDVPADRWHMHTWLMLQQPGIGSILLMQEVNDEITRSLELKERGRFERIALTDTQFKSTCRSFHPWLNLDEVKPDIPWWQQASTEVADKVRKYQLEGSANHHDHRHWRYNFGYDPMTASIHPLQRLYWAVVTRRDHLAEYFWQAAELPFVASFLCSFVHRHLTAKQMQGKRTLERSRKDSGKTTKWDTKALDTLNYLVSRHHLAGDDANVLFDEYVTYGEEEEMADGDGELTQIDMLTAEQREQNAKTRAALTLMGCDTSISKTRLDLAIMCENKLFMGHHATETFLESKWREKGGNGCWFDTKIDASPRMKYATNTVGSIAVLALYCYVYLTLVRSQRCLPT